MNSEIETALEEVGPLFSDPICDYSDSRYRLVLGLS